MPAPEIPQHLLSLSDSHLSLAAEAALAAGTVIRKNHRKLIEIDQKSAGDLVSQVDVQADRAACEILAKDSAAPILSEELNPDRTSKGDLWIVDPLDSTTSYLMGGDSTLPSTIVARQSGGETNIGVTYFPLVGQWFYATDKHGAFVDGQRLTIGEGDSAQLSESWVEMNQYGDAEFETSFFSKARRALRSSQGARIVTTNFPYSGVALRIAEARSGLAAAIHDNDASSLKQGPWDIAAIQLIFEQAGGVFLNPALNRTDPFVAEPIIVARSRELARQIVDCVRAMPQSD